MALLLIILMVSPAVAAVGYFIAAESLPAWGQQACYLAGKLVMILPAVWLFGVDRIALRIPWPKKAEVLTGHAFGLITAVGMGLAYAFVLKPSGVLSEAAQAIGAKIAGFGFDTPSRFIGFAVFVCLAHSFLEEYYWRGFVFAKLCEFMPRPAAVLVSSVAFTGHHVVILGKYFGWGSASQVVFCLGVAIGGAIWCLMLSHWKTLYAAWTSHAWIDAAIFAIGYDLRWGT